MTQRVGLAVMRIQPLSLGHLWIIGQMIAECETVIIGIGSTQAEKDIHNPWSFDQRKQMLKNVYGDRLKVMPLMDLGSDSGTQDWCEYVLDKLNKQKFPEPTDYYTGSKSDSIWYEKHFFEEDDAEFRLHIRQRDTNPFIPATDIRTFLRLKSDEWKKWTPRVNHKYIEDTFPEHLITG